MPCAAPRFGCAGKWGDGGRRCYQLCLAEVQLQLSSRVAPGHEREQKSSPALCPVLLTCTRWDPPSVLLVSTSAKRCGVWEPWGSSNGNPHPGEGQRGPFPAAGLPGQQTLLLCRRQERPGWGFESQIPESSGDAARAQHPTSPQPPHAPVSLCCLGGIGRCVRALALGLHGEGCVGSLGMRAGGWGCCQLRGLIQSHVPVTLPMKNSLCRIDLKLWFWVLGGEMCFFPSFLFMG